MWFEKDKLVLQISSFFELGATVQFVPYGSMKSPGHFQDCVR